MAASLGGGPGSSVLQSSDHHLRTARHLLNTSMTWSRGLWEAQAYCNVWCYGAPWQFGLRLSRALSGDVMKAAALSATESDYKV